MPEGKMAFTLAEACLPPLQSGEYEIRVEQELSGLGVSSPAFQRFLVEGPRFALGPGDILAVYPPPGGAGKYGHTLPHAAFNRKTLPWERSVAKQRADIDMAAPGGAMPWLALLLLHGEEIVEKRAGTFRDIRQTPDSVYFPALNVRPEEKDRLCSFIDLDCALFRRIMPALDELPLLCHARRTQPEAKAGELPPEDDWASVIIGNRLPSVADGGRNRACLVSLEGIEDCLRDPGAYSAIRLLVLHSWEFYATAEEYHFQEAFAELSTGPLRLPDAGSRQLRPLLQNGYVPVRHALRNGEATVSFFRGPLVPDRGHEPPGPAEHADSLYQYDPATGIFDVSLAAAWQLGRLLALSNERVALKILGSRSRSRLKQHGRDTQMMLEAAFCPAPGPDAFGPAAPDAPDNLAGATLGYLDALLGRLL